MGLAHSHIKGQGRVSSKGSSQRIRLPNMHSSSKHLSHSSSTILNQISNANTSQMGIASSYGSDTLLTMNTTPSSTSDKESADQCQDIDLDISEQEKAESSSVQMNSLRRSKENYSDNLFQADMREESNHYHNYQTSKEPSSSTPFENNERIIYSQCHREPALKQRSSSPALPCMPPKKQSEFDLHGPEDDEYSIAHAEIMYTQATWRMYNRIMVARAKQAELRAMKDSTEHTSSNNSFRRVPLSHNLITTESQMISNDSNHRLIESNQEISDLSSSNDVNKNCRSDSLDHAPIIFSFEMES